MSYKIRYGYDRYGQISGKRMLLLQSLVSGMLLCVAILDRSRGGALSSLLCAQPVSVTERAVAALSGALAEGEGWYWALAVWCRILIDGTAV